MDAIMPDTEILARLTRMAAEQAGMDPALVTPDHDFFNDLNFDSLDAVEFTMLIEEAFDVSIDDEVAEGVRTARQAFEMLRPFLAARSVAGGQV